MSARLNSLRMHASRAQQHVSGAERLVSDADVEEAALTLFHRALGHVGGPVDRIVLTLDCIPASRVRQARLLPVRTHSVSNWRQGRRLAEKLLQAHGIAPAVIAGAVKALAEGAAAPGQVMRGAMLIDTDTGARLEPVRTRGVRVSRMDLATESRCALIESFKKMELAHPRIIEALVLASKVSLYPEVVAELCWSDDPQYLAGYVASSTHGYQRITRLKSAGDSLGGRAIFVRPTGPITDLIDRLQSEPVLFETR